MRLLNLLGVTKHEKLPRRKSAMARYLADEDLLHVHCWRQHIGFALSGGIFGRNPQNRTPQFSGSLQTIPPSSHPRGKRLLHQPIRGRGVRDRRWTGGVRFNHVLRVQSRDAAGTPSSQGPLSLGILYSACTTLCGEKAMGRCLRSIPKSLFGDDTIAEIPSRDDSSRGFPCSVVDLKGFGPAVDLVRPGPSRLRHRDPPPTAHRNGCLGISIVFPVNGSTGSARTYFGARSSARSGGFPFSSL